MNRYKNRAAELLAKVVTELSIEDLRKSVERPQRAGQGDLAFPCFRLAKPRKQAPPQVAADLVAQIEAIREDGDSDLADCFVRIEATGPYINFYLTADAAAVFINEAVTQKQCFGRISADKKQRVLIEYSSPNVAKEFHIGHFRNTILGQSLNNIFQACGHEVIALNHLGDWGSQFGKVAYAYQNWGDEAELNKSPIDYLTKLYVRFHEESEKNPDLDKEAQQIFRKIEQKDPELTKIWKHFVDVSIEALKKMYARLGVQFDHYIGESFYVDQIDELVEQLEAKKLLVEDQGAKIVRLDDLDMPPCLILTGAGTSLYATRDLTAAIYRHSEFNFDTCLYVVGKEQTLHFRQVFAVLKKMGNSWADRLEHIAYGHYRFKDASFSTRKGRVVLARDVIDQAIEKVLEIINEKNPDLKEKEKVAEQIALGALYFNDLSTDRNKDVEFNWQKILDFEGDTGPYVQYTHARACSILRKAGAFGRDSFTVDAAAITDLCQSLAVTNLLTCFGDLAVVTQSAMQNRRPLTVANYALDLAKKFNTFYREVKVIDENASAEATETKLAIVKATRISLKNALSLLCIQAPEEM